MQLFLSTLSILMVVYAASASQHHNDIGLAKRQATILYRRGPNKKNKKNKNAASSSQPGQGSGLIEPNREEATTSKQESKQDKPEPKIPSSRRSSPVPESDHQAEQRVSRNIKDIIHQYRNPDAPRKSIPPVSGVHLTGSTLGQLSVNSPRGEIQQHYPVNKDQRYFGKHVAAPYIKGEIFQSKDAQDPTEVQAMAIGKSVEALIRVPPGSRARYWKNVPGETVEDVELTAADGHPVSVKAKSRTPESAKMQVSIQGGGSSVEVVGHDKAETAEAQPLRSVPGRDKKYPP